MSRIKSVEIESTRQTLDLNLCSLNFGFPKEVKDARADESHDEADDRNDYEHFDQRKSLLAKPTLLAPD